MAQATHTPSGRDETSKVITIPDAPNGLGMDVHAAVTYGHWLEVVARVGDETQAFVLPQSLVPDAEPVRGGIPVGRVDMEEFTDDEQEAIARQIRTDSGRDAIDLMAVSLEEGWAPNPNANHMLGSGPIGVYDSDHEAIDAIYLAHGMEPIHGHFAEEREEAGPTLH